MVLWQGQRLSVDASRNEASLWTRKAVVRTQILEALCHWIRHVGEVCVSSLSSLVTRSAVVKGRGRLEVEYLLAPKVVEEKIS